MNYTLPLYYVDECPICNDRPIKADHKCQKASGEDDTIWLLHGRSTGNDDLWYKCILCGAVIGGPMNKAYHDMYTHKHHDCKGPTV